MNKLYLKTKLNRLARPLAYLILLSLLIPLLISQTHAAPPAPTLTGKAGSRSVILSVGNISNITGLKFERSTSSSGSFTEITINNTTEGREDYNLQPNTNYYYRAYAIGASGTSPASAVLSIKTLNIDSDNRIGYSWSDLKLAGLKTGWNDNFINNILYLPSGRYGIVAIDTSNPSKPITYKPKNTVIGYSSYPDSQMIAYHNGYIYATDQDAFSGRLILRTIDVSNLNNISLVNSIDLPLLDWKQVLPESIKIINQRYLALSYSTGGTSPRLGIAIADLTQNAINPQFFTSLKDAPTSQVSFIGDQYGLSVAGNRYVYYGALSGNLWLMIAELNLANLTDPIIFRSPTAVSGVPLTNVFAPSIQLLYVGDNVLLFSENPDPVYKIDIANPSSPKSLGSISFVTNCSITQTINQLILSYNGEYVISAQYYISSFPTAIGTTYVTLTKVNGKQLQHYACSSYIEIIKDFFLNSLGIWALRVNYLIGGTDANPPSTLYFDPFVSDTISFLKSPSATRIRSSGELTFNNSVYNPTDKAITNLKITDPLPPNTAYVAGSATLNGDPLSDSGGAFSIINNTATLSMSKLAAFDGNTLSIKVKAF